jgi:hypothetical protein
MRVVVALVVTLLTVSNALAKEQVRIDSAHELARACRGLQAAASKRANPRAMVPVSNELLICLGYMQAVQDFTVLTDTNGTPIFGVCAPVDTTLRDLVQSFTKYAASHRDALNGATSVVVLQSLREAYPCEPATSSIGVRDNGH